MRKTQNLVFLKSFGNLRSNIRPVQKLAISKLLSGDPCFEVLRILAARFPSEVSSPDIRYDYSNSLSSEDPRFFLSIQRRVLFFRKHLFFDIARILFLENTYFFDTARILFLKITFFIQRGFCFLEITLFWMLRGGHFGGSLRGFILLI